LDKIISSGENYDISVHIEPFPIEDTLIQLNRELQKQQADLYAEKSKGIYNPSLEIKFNSTKKVLQDLQKGKQKLFNVSLYVLCKGKNKKEAELLSKKIKADLEGLMIQSKTPLFQMQTAYESLLPVGRDSLKVKRNIHTKGLSAFFPFSSPFLDVENEGILLGLNKNGIPYIKDIFQLTNQNGIVLATSGGGKSYFTKLMISRQHMNGCGVIIIDPQGEYLAITEHYGGETITISKNSETMINPLDLMGHEYLEKRLSLMDLFKIMF
jgi:type IV secretory pathway VirB4 component